MLVSSFARKHVQIIFQNCQKECSPSVRCLWQVSCRTASTLDSFVHKRNLSSVRTLFDLSLKTLCLCPGWLEDYFGRAIYFSSPLCIYTTLSERYSHLLLSFLPSSFLYFYFPSLFSHSVTLLKFPVLRSVLQTDFNNFIFRKWMSLSYNSVKYSSLQNIAVWNMNNKDDCLLGCSTV
jgi:hypothetical protein